MRPNRRCNFFIYFSRVLHKFFYIDAGRFEFGIGLHQPSPYGNSFAPSLLLLLLLLFLILLLIFEVMVGTQVGAVLCNRGPQSFRRGYPTRLAFNLLTLPAASSSSRASQPQAGATARDIHHHCREFLKLHDNPFGYKASVKKFSRLPEMVGGAVRRLLKKRDNFYDDTSIIGCTRRARAQQVFRELNALVGARL